MDKEERSLPSWHSPGDVRTSQSWPFEPPTTNSRTEQRPVDEKLKKDIFTDARVGGVGVAMMMRRDLQAASRCSRAARPAAQPPRRSTNTTTLTANPDRSRHAINRFAATGTALTHRRVHRLRPAPGQRCLFLFQILRPSTCHAPAGRSGRLGCLGIGRGVEVSASPQG
jgi:hypothetical protein